MPESTPVDPEGEAYDPDARISERWAARRRALKMKRRGPERARDLAFWSAMGLQVAQLLGLVSIEALGPVFLVTYYACALVLAWMDPEAAVRRPFGLRVTAHHTSLLVGSSLFLVFFGGAVGALGGAGGGLGAAGMVAFFIVVLSGALLATWASAVWVVKGVRWMLRLGPAPPAQLEQ